jgi:hypothetical protein
MGNSKPIIGNAKNRERRIAVARIKWRSVGVLSAICTVFVNLSNSMRKL